MDTDLLSRLVHDHDPLVSPYFRGVYSPTSLDSSVVDDNSANVIYILTDKHYILFVCAPYVNVYILFDALATPLTRHAQLIRSFVDYFVGDTAQCQEMSYAVQSSSTSTCAAYCLYITHCILRRLSSSPISNIPTQRLLSMCTQSLSATSYAGNERRVKQWFRRHYARVPSSVFTSALKCFR